MHQQEVSQRAEHAGAVNAAQVELDGPSLSDSDLRCWKLQTLRVEAGERRLVDVDTRNVRPWPALAATPTPNSDHSVGTGEPQMLPSSL